MSANRLSTGKSLLLVGLVFVFAYVVYNSYYAGRDDDATTTLGESIELPPPPALDRDGLNALNEARDALAVLRDAKGTENDDAIVEYRRAIELDASNALAHNNLGLAFDDKGQFDDAIVEYRRAIELDPTFADARANLGNALLVNALLAKKPLDDAIVELRRAVELDPKNSTIHYNLGDALTSNGQNDEGIAEFGKAVELDPSNAKFKRRLEFALRQDPEQ